ncbi:MAG TPA: hypothetical protein VGI92_01915 [Gemmatimonadales bacterium]|jgi:hypothetical protein
MRRSITLSVIAALAAVPLQAQGMREQLQQLFVFGSCGLPLCLDLSSAHGNHFIPSVQAGNQTVIGFVTGAVEKSAANAPISSTSSGATYSIVNGLPVRTSTSAGPIFAERSQTLGRGRLFIGTNVSTIHYSTLNGTPTDNMEFTFSHQDVPPAGLGNPLFENDVIRLNLALDINATIASVFMTYGVADFIDIGIALPFERLSLHGASTARIDPFSFPTPHHFAGTDSAPVLNASKTVNSDASGIGDAVVRVKVNLSQNNKAGVALLGEVHLPSGSTDNLLGSGNTSVRALAVYAEQFGAFAIHMNGGYALRSGSLENDAVLATAGFDNLMTPWSTLAFDLITEWPIGPPKVQLPGPIDFVSPVQREVPSTSIPTRAENRFDASLGLKFNMRRGAVIMTNVIVPLHHGSLQPDFIWTGGLEFSF